MNEDVNADSRTIAGWIKSFRSREIIGIMVMLTEEDQQKQLMEWMANHETAKPDMILQKATEIVK